VGLDALFYWRFVFGEAIGGEQGGKSVQNSEKWQAH
jgi:hypothetical protein